MVLSFANLLVLPQIQTQLVYDNGISEWARENSSGIIQEQFCVPSWGYLWCGACWLFGMGLNGIHLLVYWTAVPRWGYLGYLDTWDAEPADSLPCNENPKTCSACGSAENVHTALDNVCRALNNVHCALQKTIYIVRFKTMLHCMKSKRCSSLLQTLSSLRY